MKVTVIGLGYVGLATALSFASAGISVYGSEISSDKVQSIRSGKVPFHEPGLPELLKKCLADGSFTVGRELKLSDISFICVGTPSNSAGEIDLAYIRDVSERLGIALRNHSEYHLVVVKSTVIPETTEHVVKPIIERSSGKKVGNELGLAMNPEFLKEGSALQDMLNPDRLVIGESDSKAGNTLLRLYEHVYPGRMPIVVRTNIVNAEFIKYASNSFLATKISFINTIANIANIVPGADVEIIAKGIGLDKRIGEGFLRSGLGYGGSCFTADETVFTLNSPNVVSERFDSLFASSGRFVRGDFVKVATPRDLRVLAFDLNSGQPVLARVRAITQRHYDGDMVTIKTSMGRSLRVTADHPIVLHKGDGAFEIRQAEKIIPGDRLMALCQLPSVEQSDPLNLIELLQGSELEKDAYVVPIDNSFREQYDKFASAIPAEIFRYPNEIKRHNRMSLLLFKRLREAGKLNVPAEKLRLYTAKGAATIINAVIQVDADFFRLCGYYLAEGHISTDVHADRRAVRHRIAFSFNENETEYITDLRRILCRWGMKYIDRRSTYALTTVVSSRIFAWLIRDILRCGVRSEDKQLPSIAFNVSPELRYELVRGAFSGDGAVTPVQGNRNLMLEYATVSKSLADGMALLLQTIGVVVSIRTRWMNKSTQPAYILRVSGYEQLVKLKNVFGLKHQAKIEKILNGYDRPGIVQRGFNRYPSYATLSVREAIREHVRTTVYSMETSTGTLITSSGLISHNCFPKDVRALIQASKKIGYEPDLLSSVENVNNSQPGRVIDYAKKLLGGMEGRKVAILGLSFKPDTDDIREAASVKIIKELIESRVGEISVYDPAAMENIRRLFGDRLHYAPNPKEAIRDADCCILVTEWKEFKGLKPEDFKSQMRSPVLIDGRRIFDSEEFSKSLTFAAVGLGGRPTMEVK